MKTVSRIRRILNRYVNKSSSNVKYVSSSTNELETSALVAEKLVKRSLLTLTGDEAAFFLQGVTTNDIKLLESGVPCIYTMFLNSKGRILRDAIIYKGHSKNELFVECDRDGLNGLEKHLKMYRLRRKVDISLVAEEFQVWAVFQSKCIRNLVGKETFESNALLNKYTDHLGIKMECVIQKFKESGAKPIICEDPRLNKLGYRIILPKSFEMQSIGDDGMIIIDGNNQLSEYKECRYLLGIAEGIEEIKPAETFPLEMNCDYLHGVSFQKGCYIGQELLARTHHTGVVRKRLMPLIFSTQLQNNLPYDSHITDPSGNRKFPVGKLKGYSGTIGIGLIRVKEALKAEKLILNGVSVHVVKPFWWPLEGSEQYAGIN